MLGSPGGWSLWLRRLCTSFWTSCLRGLLRQCWPVTVTAAVSWTDSGQGVTKGCDGSAPLIDSTGTTRYNTFHDGSDLDPNHPNPPHHSTLSELFAWATLCCDARCLTLQDPSGLTQLNELQLNRSPLHLTSTAEPGNRNPHRHYVYRYNMIQHNQ